MATSANERDLSPATMRYIVEEVVRRLVREQSLGASPSTPTPTNNAAASPLAAKPSTPPANAIFSGAVLTLKDVQKLPSNQSRLSIPRRCVITPSARDELRRRGVAVDRSGDQAAVASLGTLLLVADDCATYEKGLSQALESRGFQLHRLFTTGVDERELLAIAELASKGGLALVATNASPAWLHAASRCEGLRPVLAMSAEYVARAASFRPNLLICDIVETPAAQAATIALAFARSRFSAGGA